MLDGDLGPGLREHALVHAAEASDAEEVLAFVEATGDMENVPVRKPVRAASARRGTTTGRATVSSALDRRLASACARREG